MAKALEPGPLYKDKVPMSLYKKKKEFKKDVYREDTDAAALPIRVNRAYKTRACNVTASRSHYPLGDESILYNLHLCRRDTRVKLDLYTPLRSLVRALPFHM